MCDGYFYSDCILSMLYISLRNSRWGGVIGVDLVSTFVETTKLSICVALVGQPPYKSVLMYEPRAT